MKYEETRLRLYQYFLTQLQLEKARRSGKAIRFFTILMIVTVISVVANFVFQLQGLPFIVPTLIFLVWFFPIRYSGGIDSTSELEWMVKALSGIPKEGAWHLYRMRKVLESPVDTVTRNEKVYWLLHDVDLFVQRHPESELVWFYKAEFCSIMNRHENAVEAMDRVIEKNSSALLEAYRKRAEYLDKYDKAAAKQDRETVDRMKRDGWKAPIRQKVDVTNPMDVSLNVDPIPVLLTKDEAVTLIHGNRLDEALVAARNMENRYDMVDVFIKAAEFYHEQQKSVEVSRILSHAVDAVLYVTEDKSFRGSLLIPIAEAQGRWLGVREAEATLALAVKENGLTRRKPTINSRSHWRKTSGSDSKEP